MSSPLHGPTVFGITLDLWAMAHAEDNFGFAQYIDTVGVGLSLFGF